MPDPSNISTENQPKGAAINPSDTLDKETSDVSPDLPPTNHDGDDQVTDQVTVGVSSKD